MNFGFDYTKYIFMFDSIDQFFQYEQFIDIINFDDVYSGVFQVESKCDTIFIANRESMGYNKLSIGEYINYLEDREK